MGEELSAANTFGSRIRSARRSHPGLTQRKLAEAVGIDFTYLSKLENDQVGQSPGEDLVKRLAGYLELDPEDLLAAAGKVPVEPLRDLASKDVEFARFLRTLPSLPNEDLKRLMKSASRNPKPRP